MDFIIVFLDSVCEAGLALFHICNKLVVFELVKLKRVERFSHGLSPSILFFLFSSKFL